MSLLTRLFDFQPGTLIKSADVDSEFNQLIQALSGVINTKELFVIGNNSINNEPVLKLKQIGATGQLIRCEDLNGNTVFRVDPIGNTAIGTTAAGGGKSLSVIGDNPGFNLFDNNGEDFSIEVDGDIKTLLGGANDILRFRGGASDDISFQSGSMTGFLHLSGRHAQNFTNTGNIGAGQDVLHTHTLPASFFSKVGDSLRARFGGFFAANANGKEIGLRVFGTMLFLTGSTAWNGGGWMFDVEVSRINSTDVKIAWHFGVLSSGAANIGFGKVQNVTGLTFTNTQVIECTGQSASSATDDVVQDYSTLNKAQGFAS